MSKSKSAGVTDTERLLSSLCDNTFMRSWSYPNPVKDDHKELCDLLIVFDKHVFIFFDRKNLQLQNADEGIQTSWSRWKRKVIDKQIKTADGAERYIRSGRSIFLDGKNDIPFPYSLPTTDLSIHKIIVAHGAMEACKKYSKENTSGSLAISYSDNQILDTPFHIELSRHDPVHVFDTQNLELLFRELDTFQDFSLYIQAKELAISKYHVLSYTGEEDVLANYFYNFDENLNQHFIGAADEQDLTGLMIGSGLWDSFSQRDEFLRKNEANKTSYLWDDIIQRTADNIQSGRATGHANLAADESAIFHMAKEPRFSRRALADHMVSAISDFPAPNGKVMRYLSVMPSYFSSTYYVLLQLYDPDSKHDAYCETRRQLLQLACAVVRNKNPSLTRVVGIGIEPPKYIKAVSEDLLLLKCDTWTEGDFNYYNDINRDVGLLETGKVVESELTIKHFPDP